MRTACLGLLLLGGCTAQRADARSGREAQAALGIETRAPTEREAEDLELPFEVRPQGRWVTKVSAPASGAGVERGDVLLQAGGIDLFSQDDLDDLLKVSRPGDEVTLVLKRQGEEIVHLITVALGSRRAAVTGGIAWRHASLAHLPRALAEARATGKNVLVGLSGAET